MDLFELLLIAMFILLPLLEQVFKRGRKTGELPESKLPEEEERVDARPQEREPVSAADMVPDDLWAVLTGERREPEGVATAEPEAEPAPWSAEPDRPESPWEPDELETEPGEAGTGREPLSLEYRGPEAYSLEKLDFEPVSMERPLPSPEVRHRRFHERIDRPLRPRRRARRRLPLFGGLRSAEGLRQAFILKEVLGPPKGLE